VDLQLKGKTALVMAASKGIGAGVAAALAREGCRVAIASSRKENLDRAQQAIREATGADVLAYVVDVTNPEETARRVAAIVVELGQVDIAVLNGPGPRPMAAAGLALADLRSAVDTILASGIAICNNVLPGMIERRFGRILALTSSTALEPDDGLVLSSVARAGMLAYIKTLAREVGKHGVTANAILTGSVLSDRTRELLSLDAKGSGQSYDEFLASVGATIPVGYIPEPEEFARALVFLASPLAGYVTGISLPLDGGTMRAL
jgi:3-oxoacyl-[acyl-carrier protein] reductase